MFIIEVILTYFDNNVYLTSCLISEKRSFMQKSYELIYMNDRIFVYRKNLRTK